MLTKVQELKLIARCVAFDDREAFGRLVETHQDALKRFLMGVTGGDASLTDDIAQEAFIKSWLSLRSFKGISGFRTWLFRIAYNEFISFGRKQREDSLDKGTMDSETDWNWNNLDDKMDLREALSKLPPKERSVITLFYLDDLPIKKIVEISGLPEGTVKVYLSRARERLSKLLTR